MPVVVYITPDGIAHEVDIEIGTTVMQGAMDNMIEGILGECGGSCSCATCHCYVDAAWVEKVGAPEAMEAELLTCVVDLAPNSRLSCQIAVTAALDGLVVRVPENQG